MADESQGQKTEEPTPKRLRDARRKGQVAQSRDLTAAVALVAAVAGLAATGSHLAGEWVALFSRSLSSAAHPRETLAGPLLADGLGTGLTAILPLLLAVAVLPALVSFLQVGGLFTTEPLVPKLERIDPFRGLKRLFSLNSVVETLKAMVKLCVVGAVAYAVLRAGIADVARTPSAPTGMTTALLFGLATRTAAAVAGAFLGLSALDLLYQRWRHRKELRMSKQEVKREHKESEGDPHHRAQRQRVHREILTHNMLQDVRKATVVIVNPEHIAVALVYEKGGDGAPRVVASGERILAQEIIQIAREAGVPVVRNVPLAHALSRLELGDEIPEDLYEAVAEVLDFVFRLSSASSEEGT
jgi:flagellar biosynthetic protein FlhB